MLIHKSILVYLLCKYKLISNMIFFQNKLYIISNKTAFFYKFLFIYPKKLPQKVDSLSSHHNCNRVKIVYVRRAR